MKFSFKLENENGTIKYKVSRDLSPNAILKLVSDAISALDPTHSVDFEHEEVEEQEVEEVEAEVVEEHIDFSDKIPESDSIVLKLLAFDNDSRMHIIKAMRAITGDSLMFCRDVVSGKEKMQPLNRKAAIALYTAWRKLGVMLVAHSVEEESKLKSQRSLTETIEDAIIDEALIEGPLDDLCAAV
jgi:hypothetical protein